MGVTFDLSLIEHLLENFHKITGIRYSLADTNNNLLRYSNEFTEFCKFITSNKEGYARCKECDLQVLNHVKESNLSFFTYRCHLGLVETIIPIKVNGENIAYIFLGQLVGEEDIDKQWFATREFLTKWYENPDDLKEFFYRLPTLSEDKMMASIEVLIACTYYVFMEGVINNVPMTDFQKINIHIDENYDKKISLESIARSLAISKTKLCNIAYKQETSINEMIRTRRLKEAKSLLNNTHYSISEISLRIGIMDYNYFTKIFKTYCGVTPREYRNQSKHN